MDRWLFAPSTALGLVAAWLVLLAQPAHAACHVAGFVESDVEAQESTGVISLIVELQGGQPSCAGTVDVTTVDGTAVAGEDYEAVTQTLTYEENDDRVETVDVTIVADDEDDAGEIFTVELSDPTGDISGTSGPATVTIVEGETAEGDGDEGDAPTDDQAADEAEDDGASDQDPAEGTEDADQEGSASDGGDAEQGDEEGGGNLGVIIAVIAAIVIGGGAFAVLRGRGG